jgi:NAD(P)-dependent dehydrogenase (short-subunit alcohol dehydrogenase family)
MSPYSSAVDLSGQVAMVTGGGRGLGQAYALALASSGATVAIIARSSEELAETVKRVRSNGGHANAFVADVTDRQAVERTVREIENTLGPVDLLINNAGVATPFGPVWEVDPDEWWRCLDINVRGSFLCARSVLPGMIQRRRGRIINLSSGLGVTVTPYSSGYSVSKCAILRFTDTLAAETAEYGVSIFAISPGLVHTAMSNNVVESPEGQKWLPWYGQFYDKATEDSPKQAVELVLLLASGKADVLSGRYIAVADNVTELVERVEDIKRNNLHILTLNRLTQ